MDLTVKQGFKFGVGCYLAVSLLHALNKTLGKKIGPSIQKLTDQMNDNDEES